MQNRIRVGLLASAVITSLVMLPAAAETYKWTDAEGKVHYSDQPPPANVKDPATLTPRKKTSRSAPATEGGAQAGEAKAAETKPAPKTTQELDAEFKQRQVEAAEREAAQKKALQEAEEKKRNCAQAKAQVARYQGGGRFARYNDKGETEYMDDAQVAQELARSQQVADSWCK